MIDENDRSILDIEADNTGVAMNIDEKSTQPDKRTIEMSNAERPKNAGKMNSTLPDLFGGSKRVASTHGVSKKVLPAPKRAQQITVPGGCLYLDPVDGIHKKHDSTSNITTIVDHLDLTGRQIALASKTQLTISKASGALSKPMMSDSTGSEDEPASSESNEPASKISKTSSASTKASAEATKRSKTKAKKERVKAAKAESSAKFQAEIDSSK